MQQCQHAAAPYMHAWDEIVGEGGKGTVRRLLGAADAAPLHPDRTREHSRASPSGAAVQFRVVW
jgi:hypothetical protein